MLQSGQISGFRELLGQRPVDGARLLVWEAASRLDTAANPEPDAIVSFTKQRDAHLMGEGVEFVSAPTTAPNGERFVFLKDQDGTFLKLVEDLAGEPVNPGPPNLVRLVNVNMNVADLERSREFYRLLGFTEEEDGSQQGSGTFAEAQKQLASARKEKAAEARETSG